MSKDVTDVDLLALSVELDTLALVRVHYRNSIPSISVRNKALRLEVLLLRMCGAAGSWV